MDRDKDSLDRYKAVIRREKAWRLANADTFEKVVEEWAVAEMTAERPFTIQTALEAVRSKARVDAEGGEGGRVANDYGAIWSRLLCARYPGMERFVLMRPSVYDAPELRSLIC